MSSSLFDTWGSDWEPYLNTERIEGVKTFREVMNGDTLYYLDRWGDMKELKVTYHWHPAKGHFFITCGRKTIDFGPAYTANVSDDTPRASIAHYDGGILGTTKEVVIDHKRKNVEDKVEDLKREIRGYEKILENLNKLK